MREIITTTGASLFTAGVIVAQALVSPLPAATPLAPAHATTLVLAR